MDLIWRIKNIFNFLNGNYIFIYKMVTKVQINAQTMAHLHGGATL